MQSVKRWVAGRRRGGGAPFPGTAAFTPAEFWRRWVAFRHLRNDLFGAGGAAIESPDPDRGTATTPRLVDARTVVQADGDVLWFIRTEAMEDPSVLTTHVQKVADWYAHSARTVNALGVYLRALRVTASFVIGFLAAVTSAGGWRWWIPVATVVAGTVLQPVIHAVIGWLLRRSMGAVLT